MSAILQLYDKLLQRLTCYQHETSAFANPIQLLALEIANQLQSGALTIQELEQLVNLLCTKGFFLRAERLRTYIGELDIAQNKQTISKLIAKLADQLSFAEFSKLLETAVFGIVITAHPTFCISEELANALAQVVTTANQPPVDISRFTHRPDQPITLAYEHQASLQAITNIQDAIQQIYETVITVAKQYYPQQWQDLTPRLMTIASWVGYDLDGRVDITWSDTLLVRMQAALWQVERYLTALQPIPQLSKIYQELSARRDQLNQEIALLTEYIKNQADLNSLLKLQASNEQHPHLTDLTAIAEQLHTVIKETKDPDLTQQLLVLRAAMLNYNLGAAQVHVRVNAIQLHNAIHSKIKIESLPENSAEQQYYIEALTALLDQVQPVTTNFGAILRGISLS